MQRHRHTRALGLLCGNIERLRIYTDIKMYDLSNTIPRPYALIEADDSRRFYHERRQLYEKSTFCAVSWSQSSPALTGITLFNLSPTLLLLLAALPSAGYYSCYSLQRRQSVAQARGRQVLPDVRRLA